ncbi:6-phosphogluconolactonase [Caballeronia fortuita]|uniref:6-phosphogluconolactonase n=1 Tax=Caballeronia fortuita TaxID=1777138 RepID=A0A158CTQ6_9BURK|nr:beta-propeller fold lactonase family protein [Caballeronia fortuita]SAK85775.1 6-phosphogluconolactonase [Caballeronia fortuita]
MLNKRLIASAIPMAFLAACGGNNDSSPAAAAHTVSPQLFAQSDDNSNAVLQFIRRADGSLGPVTSIPTGGKGTGGVAFAGGGAIAPDSLTSNSSVAVNADRTRLFVVNAGDATVSVFSIDPAGGKPTLLATSSTGGLLPTSLAVSNNVLYVTHQRGANQLGAYRISMDGKLTQIGTYPTVQADALPTQVSVSPDGTFVLVDIRSQSNVVGGTPGRQLLTYRVNGDGSLAAPVVSPTVGSGPFGTFFGSGPLSRNAVSVEAISNSVASYRLNDDGTLSAASGPLTVPGQGAPCWLALTPDNKFAYVGNAAGFISSYAVGANGELSLINGNAASEPPVVTGSTSFAEDSWISPDSKFLYQDFPGDDKVVAYSIGANGGLTKLNEQPAKAIGTITLQGLAGT